MHGMVTRLCLLAMLAAPPVQAQGGLAEAAAPESREILVRFQPSATPLARRGISARARGTIVRSNAVLGFDKLVISEGVSIAAALDELRRERGVVWAEQNGTYTAAACTNCPQDPFLLSAEDRLMPAGQNQWGVFLAGIPWLWRQGGGGSGGTIIAILDTGIDDFASPHPDLAANVLATGYDAVDNDNDPTDVGAGNLYGHGTHVAGIAAAAANSIGIAGVAYDSKLMIVRVLDCTAGSGCPGTFEEIANGVQFAADSGARVINLSIQGTVASNAVRTAIQYAIGKGAIVVAAAGNQGAPSVSYPARFEEVIAVGASDSLDHVASFSNYGPELDIVAPGDGQWSAFPGPTYAWLRGTSQATPFVSGIAALMLDREPNIKQAEMERFLRAHAIPLTGSDAARDGYGRIGFPVTEDWSDAPPPYSAARHENHLWEWLGRDVSSESSISDPFDTDFRPNIGSPQSADAYDDGTFPGSFPSLPFLPPHLGPTPPVSVGLQVARFGGPRYGPLPANQLHLDLWFDWNSDGVFDAGAGERPVADHLENPATWGANTKLVTLPFPPIDEHILGNPLVVRTRLSYGASPGNADSTAKFGEVEDHSMVNFVEDYDKGPGDVYTISGSWSVVSDPAMSCAHRGMGFLGYSTHPAAPGAPCNGFIESMNVMGTPTMNWSEYTTAKLTFWYCHQLNSCAPGAAGDFCRLRIDTSGVKHNLMAIPTGSGTMTVDLSGYCGAEAVIIEFVEETDIQGRIAIDDVVVTAFDPQPAVAVSNLALTRAPGGTELALSWTATSENLTAPSPPTDRVASTYDIRHARTPIASDADWNKAERFEPREVSSGGAPVPGTPGTGQSHSFRVPSAFEPYYVALRVGDEVVNLGGISNSPGDAGTGATIGVTVLSLADTLGAPGDTVSLPFRITNTGNTNDLYAVHGTDTGGWQLLGVPTSRSVDAASSVVFTLPVVIPPGASAADRDTISLFATSLADGTTQDADAGEVEVSGTVAVPGPGPVASRGGLQDLGPLPFRESLTFGLRLAHDEQASLRIFDLGGRLVRELGDRRLPAGTHRFEWNGLDEKGQRTAAGFYFLQARTPSFVETRRVLRLD